MVTNIKDLDGKVIAYCEWRLVGPSGYEVPSGEYIWINDIWVHEDFRNTQKVNRIIDEIMTMQPQAKYCYFHRLKKNNKIRIYKKDYWDRRRNAYDSLINRRN
jgi:hypothetical protein